MGDLHVGVRSTSAEVDALLRRLLAAHLVPGGEAPANFSLVAGTAGNGRGPQSLHVLYRSSNAVARSRRVGDLLHALVDWLTHLGEPDRPDRLAVDATVVVADGGVVLAPLRALRWEPAELDTQLRRRRLALHSLSSVGLDVAGGHLVVPEPTVSVDRSVLDELRAPTGGRGWLAPGRYPVLGWVLAAPGVEVLSRAAAVAVAAGAVTNPSTVGAGAVLGSLGQVFSRVPAVPVSEAWSASQVTEAVAAALAAGRDHRSTS